MIIINREQAETYANTLKKCAMFKNEDSKVVDDIVKCVYILNNCEFEIYSQHGEIVRIDVYKYYPNGQLYDLEERHECFIVR